MPNLNSLFKTKQKNTLDFYPVVSKRYKTRLEIAERIIQSGGFDLILHTEWCSQLCRLEEPNIARQDMQNSSSYLKNTRNEPIPTRKLKRRGRERR